MTAALPSSMRAKVVVELAPVAGLPGFCWTWTGALNSRGYGCVGINGKSQLSHRVAYTLLVGPIEPGLQIDHLCRNKRCCNPAHLEPVTARVNMRRTDAVGKSHCVHGHRLAGENVILKKSGGYVIRNCRECTNQRKRKTRASA